MAKTFLLGAGAQKAGTTWLYESLRRSPQLKHGFRKEYHVLDVRELDSEAWMRTRVLEQAQDSLEALRGGSGGSRADGDALHRLSMVADFERYFDYFAGLLRTAPRIRAAADFTPSHALLPVETLRTVRAGFERRGIRAAAVMVLRDPVERIWSQVRMQHQRNPAYFDGASAVGAMRARHTAEEYVVRSDYPRTVAALDEAFGVDVHYAFYERLFTSESVAEVCAFAGIEVPEVDVEDRRNTSTDQELPTDVRAECALHHRAVYEQVAVRFPDVDLPALWPNARLALR